MSTNALAACASGTATRYDFTADFLKLFYLADGGFNIAGIGLGHGLDNDGRAATDGNATDFNLFTNTTFIHIQDHPLIPLLQRGR